MITVLIAEDDFEIRATLKLVLDDANYPTLEASNGQQALAIVRTAPQPLIVLLDIGMPFLDGLSLLHQVAQQPELHRHAYILLTGFHPTKYAVMADLMTQLQVQVVHKPFDIDRLLSVVQQAETSLTANRQARDVLDYTKE